MRFNLKVIVLSMLVCLYWTCRPKPSEVIMADYLIHEQLTSALDSVKIDQILDTLLAGTVWEEKVQINQPYQPGLIYLYIIDGNATKTKYDDQVSPLLANCFYAGSNVIFVDGSYLQTFLDYHHVSRRTPSNDLLNDQECFLYWVIGHELGHLVCGHLRGRFETASLDHFVKSSSLENRQEMQADSSFVQAIVPRRKLRYSEEALMMSILNAEIQQKIGKVTTAGVGILYDYTNQHIVSYAKQPTHPEYVIRLSRMLELTAKMSDDTGTYNLVSGFIKQLKEVN